MVLFKIFVISFTSSASSVFFFAGLHIGEALNLVWRWAQKRFKPSLVGLT